MKRLAVLGTVATLAVLCIAAVPKTAHAQLTMQMGNGWSFTFAGNVNAFEVETFGSDSTIPIAYGLVNPAQGTVNRLRTGLLPAFAVFEAKGKEGPFNLAVHFGFAPQIQNGGVHDNFGNGTQAGAQIDMRQVYLTVGGDWGQILAGREIGLYQRENILTDMTLFGIGATGGQIGAGGTTLGRIGFGYTYPNFNAQVTYSTPATSTVQWSIGLFDPSTLNGESGPARFTRIPRVETELTWTGKLGDAADKANTNKVLVWVGGVWQNANFQGHVPSGAPSDSSRNAYGVDAGVKFDIGQLSIVGSGYYDKGVGTTLMFTTTAGFDAVGDGRKSYGYIGQIVYQIDPKWNIGASIGASNLKSTTNDTNIGNNGLLSHNLLGTGEVTYQWTKSLKWVAEGDYTQASDQGSDKNHEIQLATGLMLFF
jgi:hypothetical protein